MNTIESSALSGDQLRARIAWYYFVAGLTQQEISDRLGIARARVNKIAGQLRTPAIAFSKKLVAKALPNPSRRSMP